MAKDPVCGMEVDEKKAAARAEHMGKTYYADFVALQRNRPAPPAARRPSRRTPTSTCRVRWRWAAAKATTTSSEAFAAPRGEGTFPSPRTPLSGESWIGRSRSSWWIVTSWCGGAGSDLGLGN